LHVDVDVLDQGVMPAVDSPGSPGLNFDEFRQLIEALCLRTPVIGVDVTIYDPELDPERVYANDLASNLASSLAILAR
jgi:arginase